jgi:hypothetical protein
MAIKEADQRDIFDLAESIEIPSSENVSMWKSVPSAIGRGLLEGGIAVNKLFTGGGLEGMSPRYTQQESELKEQRRENIYEKYLPTDNSLVSRGIERGITSGLEAAAFPVPNPLATAGRGTLGGAAAEAGKDLGFPEWAQSLIEIGAQISPSLTKQLLAKDPSQKELLDFARSQGMTEKQIALSLQEPGGIKQWLAKIADKGSRTQQKITDTKSSISNIYDNIRSYDSAKNPLTGQQASKFLGELNKKLSTFPAEMRNKIATDYKDLLGSQMTGSDILDFHHKLNYYIAKGERQLGTLKEPITSALKSVDAELAKDFGLANKLYGNLAKTSKMLKQSQLDKLVDLGTGGALLGGILTGNLSLLQKVIGKVGASHLANQIITNPRLQNFTTKLASSVKQGLIPASKKILNQIIFEVAKDNQSAAKELADFDIEDFFK